MPLAPSQVLHNTLNFWSAEPSMEEIELTNEERAFEANRKLLLLVLALIIHINERYNYIEREEPQREYH